MLQNTPQHIFVFGHPLITQNLWKHLEETHQIQTFQTDNIYQLQQYTREITPQILIFNITDAPSLVAFKKIMPLLKKSSLVILISPQTEIPVFPNVAHHLRHPLHLSELNEIIASYSIGHQMHDVLLIDRPSPETCPLKQHLIESKYHIFEVHTIDAAKLYLQKNTTKAVFIEYMPQFVAGRHYLQHPQIFYVDRQQDITEISKFLH